MFRIGAVCLMSCWLLACTTAPPASSEAEPPAATTEPQARAQSLPISAQVEIGGELIELEVARSPEEQAIGLMYRPSLPDNRGMLFPFETAQPVSFWMKNVEIALDMIFLNGDEVVAIAADVPPCRTTPCPVYGPDAPVDRVLELRGGRAAELGVQVGDRLAIDWREDATPAASQ